MKRVVLTFFIILFYSSNSFADCSFLANFGISKNQFQKIYNHKTIPIPGEWGLEEYQLTKKTLCPNSKLYNDISANYNFLEDKLVEIRVVSIENNTRHLIDEIFKKYGNPTQQSENHNLDVIIGDQNQYFWSKSNMEIFAEYFISSQDSFQEAKFVSTRHDSVFDKFYTNMEKGVDPTYQERVRNARLEIAKQFEQSKIDE